jgi:hypothetical protein
LPSELLLYQSDLSVRSNNQFVDNAEGIQRDRQIRTK